MFEKVLIALDGSENARDVLAAAKELVKLSGGEARVVHVREGHFIGRAGIVPEEGHDEAMKIVDNAVAELTSAGVMATGTLRASASAMVAREILDEAQESAASVIVMGSRGISDLAGLVIGSTAHKVLHLGTWPVLIVR